MRATLVNCGIRLSWVYMECTDILPLFLEYFFYHYIFKP
jgi:hypothetical protein